MPRIRPCLLSVADAEKAARFYVSVFPNSKILNISRYGDAGRDVGHKPSDVLTVEFTLDGQRFMALNGPDAPPSMAVSFVVSCRNQAEIDRYWKGLSRGGDPSSQVCGWLKDRFGLWWQIVPDFIPKVVAGKDRAAADRLLRAIMRMKKLDVAALKKAYQG